jgi:hypothetical protein
VRPVLALRVRHATRPGPGATRFEGRCPPVPSPHVIDRLASYGFNVPLAFATGGWPRYWLKAMPSKAETPTAAEVAAGVRSP